MPNKVAPSSQRVEPDPTGIAARVQQLTWRLESGELRGYRRGEVEPNGEWFFDSGNLAFDATPTGPAAQNRFDGQNIIIVGAA